MIGCRDWPITTEVSRLMLLKSSTRYWRRLGIEPAETILWPAMEAIGRVAVIIFRSTVDHSAASRRALFSCPLWVKSGSRNKSAACLSCLQTRTFSLARAHTVTPLRRPGGAKAPPGIVTYTTIFGCRCRLFLWCIRRVL